MAEAEELGRTAAGFAFGSAGFLDQFLLFDQAAEILRGVGYDELLVAEVRRINLKQGLHTNADVQTMEDALCLSFLEHELEEFATRYESDKVVEIIRKTWGKMSERAHVVALSLALPSRSGSLVALALNAA